MTAPALAAQAPQYVRGLSPYVGGKPIEEVARELGLDPARIVKLASNENPRGPSPRALAAIATAAAELTRYPDGNAFVLKQALAERLGVDPQGFLDAIAGGPLDTPYAKLKGGAMIAREFPPAFPLRLAAKDAALIVDAAGDTGLDLPLVRAVADQLAAGVERGHGDEDLAATLRTALE